MKQRNREYQKQYKETHKKVKMCFERFLFVVGNKKFIVHTKKAMGKLMLVGNIAILCKKYTDGQRLIYIAGLRKKYRFLVQIEIENTVLRLISKLD